MDIDENLSLSISIDAFIPTFRTKKRANFGIYLVFHFIDQR